MSLLPLQPSISHLRFSWGEGQACTAQCDLWSPAEPWLSPSFPSGLITDNLTVVGNRLSAAQACQADNQQALRSITQTDLQWSCSPKPSALWESPPARPQPGLWDSQPLLHVFLGDLTLPQFSDPSSGTGVPGRRPILYRWIRLSKRKPKAQIPF